MIRLNLAIVTLALSNGAAATAQTIPNKAPLAALAQSPISATSTIVQSPIVPQQTLPSPSSSPAPSPSSSPNIRTIDYSADSTIRLTGHTGFQMLLEFDAGEKVETVGIGDSTGWQITPNGAGTIMFLKPVAVVPPTNLSIITNQRRYIIELVSKPGTKVPPSQITYTVRFRYPKNAVETPQAGAAAAPIITAPPEDWNRNYSFDGSKNNVPDQVFDDGKSTYFRFVPGTATPAIFSISPQNGEGIVNFAVRGPYIVVDQVAAQFVLRQGKDVTVIFNDSYAPAAPGPEAPRQRERKKKKGQLDKATEKLLKEARS
jgi:type IV secretion system protein VirB9